MEDYIDLVIWPESITALLKEGNGIKKLNVQASAQKILDEIGKEHIFEWVKQNASIDEIGDLVVGMVEGNNE